MARAVEPPEAIQVVELPVPAAREAKTMLTADVADPRGYLWTRRRHTSAGIRGIRGFLCFFRARAGWKTSPTRDAQKKTCDRRLLREGASRRSFEGFRQ